MSTYVSPFSKPILVEVSAVKVTGTNKAQKPYCILAGYAHVGEQYPQPIEFYSEVQYAPGSQLLVPLVPSAKDGRLAFLPDFKAAKLTETKAA